MTSADHAWASALERRLWLRCFRDRGWLTQTFRANQAAPCSRLGSAHTRKHGAALKPLVSILVEIARAACGSGQEARPVGRGSCPVRVIGGHCAPVRHWRAYAACSSGGRLFQTGRIPLGGFQNELDTALQRAADPFSPTFISPSLTGYLP
jgi:hypothetical protein